MAVVKGTKSNKGRAGDAETRAWLQANDVFNTSHRIPGSDKVLKAVHNANTADTTPGLTNTFSTHLKNMFKKGK